MLLFFYSLNNVQGHTQIPELETDESKIEYAEKEKKNRKKVNLPTT